MYAFSLENWRRPKAEIDFLMRLLRQYLRKELPVIHRNNIRLQIIGRTDQLPAGVQADVEKGMALTASNTGMSPDGGAELWRARGTGGRLQCHLRTLRSGAAATAHLANFEVDEQMIAENLYTAGLPDPDLLIRTSGEMRVSNFLLWQIAYAEIYVTDTLWPDFCRAELYAALVDYQKRERRYGGLAAAARRVQLHKPNDGSFQMAGQMAAEADR